MADWKAFPGGQHGGVGTTQLPHDLPMSRLVYPAQRPHRTREGRCTTSVLWGRVQTPNSAPSRPKKDFILPPVFLVFPQLNNVFRQGVAMVIVAVQITDFINRATAVSGVRKINVANAHVVEVGHVITVVQLSSIGVYVD